MTNSISDRQVQIIKASGKLLMEKGILGLTTKNLAQEMNFSESALYRHFKNKEAIIILLIQYLGENISNRFEEIINSESKADEKLKNLFQSQFAFFKENPHFIVIVLSDGLLDHTEDIKAEIQKLMSTNATHFKSIIEEGQQQNIFSEDIDSQYLIHFTMGSFRLQMLKWKMSNFTFDIELQGMKTMNNLIKLLKNKP